MTELTSEIRKKLTQFDVLIGVAIVLAIEAIMLASGLGWWWLMHAVWTDPPPLALVAMILFWISGGWNFAKSIRKQYQDHASCGSNRWRYECAATYVKQRAFDGWWYIPLSPILFLADIVAEPIRIVLRWMLDRRKRALA